MIDYKITPHPVTFTLNKIIDLFTSNPRNIVGLKSEFKVGNPAEITLFNPNLEYTFTEKDIKSKSRNTPFVGVKFTGKALGIISKGQLHLNS